MSALEAFVAELSADVPEALVQAVKDAATCRENVYGGDEVATLPEIHAHLVRNRAMIERMEYLTSTLSLLKSRSANVVAARRAEYDDAYAKAATKSKIGFADDFTSAKEKDAAANVAATEELYALRKAEKVHRDVDSAWDYCRILLRGAEGAQRDLETRIRLITLTTQMGG